MSNNRLTQLRSAMQSQGLEAILLTNPVNRRYMTGFTGSSGYALVTADQAFLLTDFRYMEQAAAEVDGFEVVEHASLAIATVKDLLDRVHIRKLGFEHHHLTVGTHQEYAAQLGIIELVPSAGLVEKLRMYKDEQELAIMQDAAHLADRTFAYIVTKLKPGCSEKEIALEMEYFMRKHGATSSSFDTIVASGERSALPHGVASDRLLGRDEFVKLDFGAYYQGYCSDLTRTVVLGQPTQKHRDIYAIVLDAQLAVLDQLKPGMTGREADAVARDRIAAAGYGECFGHGTGHGLGMEIHESPRLSKLSSMILEPGMVVTVEPGIYLPGFGGVRIEDDVVITNDGIRVLTRTSKELLVLE